jgi:hypothetical protein
MWTPAHVSSRRAPWVDQEIGRVSRCLGYVKDGPHAEGIPESVKARVAELQEMVAKGRIVVPSK